MLPYSAEVLFVFLGNYYDAIAPVPVLAYVMLGGAGLLAARPFPGSARIVGLVLAAFWIWCALVWFRDHFSEINFAAPIHAAVFGLEAFLIAWWLAVRGTVPVRIGNSVQGWTGAGIVLFAAVGHPLLGLIAGHAPQLPGVTPAPTALLTLGVLLLTGRRLPVTLGVIPLLWALAVGVEAWVLDIPEHYVTPVLGLLAMALMLERKARLRGTEAGPT